MKKNVKLTLVVVMVAAAVFGGVKTYGAYGTAVNSDQLLSENVEALSGGEDGGSTICYDYVTICLGKSVCYCENCIWLDDADGEWSSGSSVCYP